MGAHLTSGRRQKPDAIFTGGRMAKGDTVLPPAGYDGPTPEWPLDGPSAAELHRWNWLWRKPQAVMWAMEGIEDVLARYVRNCITLETGGASTVASAYMVSEVRQQEDRFGRSPLALQRMRWFVGEREQEAMATERGEGNVRRLRAIDPAVAAEG